MGLRGLLASKINNNNNGKSSAGWAEGKEADIVGEVSEGCWLLVGGTRRELEGAEEEERGFEEKERSRRSRQNSKDYEDEERTTTTT